MTTAPIGPARRRIAQRDTCRSATTAATVLEHSFEPWGAAIELMHCRDVEVMLSGPAGLSPVLLRAVASLLMTYLPPVP